MWLQALYPVNICIPFHLILDKQICELINAELEQRSRIVDCVEDSIQVMSVN